VDEAAYAASMGIDMIITDHHECRNQILPAAVAVVDPKREGCPYPNKELAGVGVALKLACAVDGNCMADAEKYATWWPWAPWPT
jgi:single-stranded-DNA-specific exonuclease